MGWLWAGCCKDVSLFPRSGRKAVKAFIVKVASVIVLARKVVPATSLIWVLVLAFLGSDIISEVLLPQS